jgi:hypothetical protein
MAAVKNSDEKVHGYQKSERGPRGRCQKVRVYQKPRYDWLDRAMRRWCDSVSSRLTGPRVPDSLQWRPFRRAG